ncbi:hypothetical protein ACVNPS_07190 [Candidatus Bipolaricaulota sp. J31]
MRLGGERHAVQGPLIRYAEEVGWEHSSPEGALRRDQAGTVSQRTFKIPRHTKLFRALLSAYFHEKYPDLELPDLRGNEKDPS